MIIVDVCSHLALLAGDGRSWEAAMQAQGDEMAGAYACVYLNVISGHLVAYLFDDHHGWTGQVWADWLASWPCPQAIARRRRREVKVVLSRQIRQICADAFGW